MSEDYMLNYFKELDERNRYWINVFKIMPKELQEQIMFISFSVSTGIMIWIQAGFNEKEIKIRSEIINRFEEIYKKKCVRLREEK